MTGFEVFQYDGEVIRDVRAWALERGERMVRYRRWRDVPSIFSGKLEREEEEGEMPETFFDGLTFGGPGGWFYEELGRE